jgi:hypothetical protein
MGKQRQGILPGLAAQGALDRSVGRSARRTSGVTGGIAQALSLVAIACGVFALVWLYGSGLRDPRYLDGWILAAGMILQLYFHIAIKTASLSPKWAVRWRKIHIFSGYALIAAFVSHCDVSLPDTPFEWVLWTSFVLVTVSGIASTYLAWSLKSKRGLDDRITLERIPARRAELAQEVQDAVTQTDPQAAVDFALPAPPYEAWISDLYSTHLEDFFEGPRNAAAHAIGSQRPLKRLTDEIDALSGYADRNSQDKLALIKSLVIEKDRLDFARVYLGLTRGALFVHVPVTYALIVLVVLHGVVAYAFSAGAW